MLHFSYWDKKKNRKFVPNGNKVIITLQTRVFNQPFCWWNLQLRSRIRRRSTGTAIPESLWGQENDTFRNHFLRHTCSKFTRTSTCSVSTHSSLSFWVIASHIYAYWDNTAGGKVKGYRILMFTQQVFDAGRRGYTNAKKIKSLK